MNDMQKIFFTLESETHRISQLNVEQYPQYKKSENNTLMELAPISELYRLRYEVDGELTETTFFEREGPRKGYVKNNTKLLERILISWWAFDWRVGEDKAYMGGDTSNTSLYTSLKFWAREESDLKNFPKFLKYWGWSL